MHKRHARSTGLILKPMLFTCLLLVSPVVLAVHPNTKPPLKHMHVDLKDKAALRTGAMYFMHQCMACHSLQGARFSELAPALGLTKKQIQASINISRRGFLDTIVSPMPPAFAKSYLGVAPPDLTDETNLRSIDWLYTYFTSFYVDPSRPTGVNNVAFHNVAMPDVFAGLQGLQSPVTRPGYRYGQKVPIAVGVKPLTQGSMSPAQFDHMARDLVAFLYYMGHPHQQQSHAIGFWVLIITAFWTILVYLMYRLFWRDIDRPHGPRWWSYWKR